MPKAPRTGFLVTLAGGLIASAACGCEAVLGLDWTPSDQAEAETGAGQGGAGGAAADAGSGETGASTGDSASSASGASSGPGAECDLAACPAPSGACEVAACVAFACAIVATSPGAPCSEDGGAVCDGGGRCVECNTHLECSGPGATCADHVCGSCDDDVPNGLETDTDCGGGVCEKCALGRACLVDTDCKGKASCVDGICTEDD